MPFALDLWAAGLAAGLPVVTALEFAALASDEPLRSVLGAVVAAQRSGETASAAWDLALTDVVKAEALEALARAAARSERDGTALQPVLGRLAADVRAAAAGRGLAAARRAGVWAVLPLGLCSLPAYVLLGVVPTVTGLIGHLR